MARTQLLDLLTWDVCLTVGGDIAIADAPWSLAQDVASACRTFLGEEIYDTSVGVPYDQILGHQPSNAFIKAQLELAALTVPGVLNPAAFITGVKGRNLTGQISFQDASGQTLVAAL